jgi:general secretion pathway protein L
MQQKLVIYHSAIQTEWIVLNELNEIIQHVQQGHPDELANLAEGKEVIVFIPAHEIFLTTAQLPKMTRSRLLEALPYALEDQVIADVDTLHFVPGESDANGLLPVAIIAKQKMQATLDTLKSWKIQPDKLIPDIFAVPLEHATWTILLHDSVLLRMDAMNGFACEINNLNEMLMLALQSAKQKPLRIHIYNFTQTEMGKTLNVDVQIQEQIYPEKKWLELLAKNVLHIPYINLLQGQYKSRKARFPEMQKLLKTAGLLTAAWVGLLLLYPLFSYWILHHRVSQLDNEIAQIYHRHFPESVNVVAPKIRMQEKLQRTTTDISANKWLLILAYLGKDITQSHDVQIKRMDYQRNRMTIDLSAVSSEAFSTFTDYLTNQGLSVKQESANVTGERVTAMITVE